MAEEQSTPADKVEYRPMPGFPGMPATAMVPLTRGMFALVDAVDLPLLSGRSWQAHVQRAGKLRYAVSDKVKMHRLLMNPPDGMIVDHINGDGLDNRRSNLRIGTHSQNCVNRLRTPGKYLRGARPKKGKWQAYIKYAGRCRSLGYHATEKQAHEAYLSAARELHGDWMPITMPLPPLPEVTPCRS